MGSSSLVRFFERVQFLCCRLFKCGGEVDEVDGHVGSVDGMEMVAVGGQMGSGRESPKSDSSTDVSGEFVLHSKTNRPVCSPTPQ